LVIKDSQNDKDGADFVGRWKSLFELDLSFKIEA
jgi:hypothetical protein